MNQQNFSIALVAAKCKAKRDQLFALHRRYKIISLLLKVIIFLPTLFVYPSDEQVNVILRYAFAFTSAMAACVTVFRDYSEIGNTYRILSNIFGATYDDLISHIARNRDHEYVRGLIDGRILMLPMISRDTTTVKDRDIIFSDLDKVMNDSNEERQILDGSNQIKEIRKNIQTEIAQVTITNDENLTPR